MAVAPGAGCRRPARCCRSLAGLDTYGHLFPSELEVLADRLEQVRGAALARRLRTDVGSAVGLLRETAGR